MIFFSVVLFIIIRVFCFGCSYWVWKFISLVWVRVWMLVLLLLLVKGMVYGWLVLYSSVGSMCIVEVFGLIFFWWMLVI